MVHVKVTDGVETRRFQVTPGELSYQQLKERIAGLFPEAGKDLSLLTLRYRDTDGDVITLSSDEEWQAVLSDLPENHVWKLHISTSPPAGQSKTPRSQRRSRPLLDQLLQPTLCSLTTDSNPWAGFDRQLRETQQLLELFLGGGRPSGEKEESKTEEKGETQSDGSAAPETTQTEGVTGEGEAKPAGGEGDEEEVKSKPSSAGGAEEGSKPTPSECPLGGRCRVKRVAVWEPLLFGGGLFGSLLSPPVQAYHITFTPTRPSSSATESAASA